MSHHTSSILSFAAWLSGAAAAAQTQPGTITLRDTRIYYEAAGPSSARPIVFIHGFALNLREWDDQVKALSPEYRIVSYDRRGFGKSTGIADVFVEPGDLKELLDTLGVRSAVLVGHSGGAGVAMRFAVAHRDRVDALVLYPGQPPQGFPIAPTEPNPLGRMSEFVRSYGLDSLFKFMLSLPQFWFPPDRPDILARIDSMTATYSGRDLLERRPTSGPYLAPTLDQMKAFPKPTLFIAGEREAKYALLVSDSMARWMPNARRVVIPGGGHGVHLNEPERFNTTLREFLRSLPPPSPR
jgi:pimeloyl-ACP methyl ester carboxylesterase